MTSIASRFGRLRGGLLTVAVLAGLALVLVGAHRARGHSSPTAAPTEAAQRRTVTVTVDATGTVEPIDLVEIKSKASGQITEMPVEVGTTVKAGDLLAQIDRRDVQNQYDQASAALKAAQARVDIAAAAKQRSDALFAQQVTTADEHESATLTDAAAQADLVKARTDLDLARQRLEDATVRAPIAGTVLEQLVSNGQVISSATSSASGGTSLLRMADLSRIRMRALVNETDIGNVKPGQTVNVSVDAFAQQTFVGTVEKIEPQAVVQQSVTMFPVLISISNEKRQLLPGMNGEVSMLVAEQDNVVAIPIEAVRTVREIPAMAATLGLDAEAVRTALQQQVDARHNDRAAGLMANPAGTPHVHHDGKGKHQGQAAAPGQGPAAVQADMSSRRSAGRAQAVLVKTAHGLEPRLVKLGLTNFDYAEVIDGLQEGDEVALLSVAEVLAQRQQDQNRIKQRIGTGVPGAPAAGGSRGSGGGKAK